VSFHSNGSSLVEFDELTLCDKTTSAEHAPYSEVGKPAGLKWYCVARREVAQFWFAQVAIGIAALESTCELQDLYFSG